MRLSVALTTCLAAGLAAGLGADRARGHVTASPGDNNRYLKLTPMGDRVRLAYTVFYGDRPGAELRRAIDTNHDGAIDDAESQAFGGRVARDIAAALDAVVDGAHPGVRWSEVVVGLGTPQVAAGAFSIDLIASLCLASPRGAHAMELRDRTALDHPGETEIVFEDSPGVKLDRARVADDTEPGFDFKIIGPTPVLGDAGTEGGIALAFTAGAQAVVAPDAACARPAPPRSLPIAAVIAVAGAIAAAAGAIRVARRRPRDRRKSGA